MIRSLFAIVLLSSLAADEHPLSPEQREKINEDLDESIQKYGELIASDAKSVESYSMRGDALFKRGHFAKAVADYEKMVELDKGLDAGHWRRGIAHFYAGYFDKAAAQFEAYHSFDNVDRENGIWRYFSQYKASGPEKARAGLLKYAKDDREPFPSVYQLFEGKITPEKILAQIQAAKIGDGERDSRLFYANLYAGLNSAVENRPEEAAKFLREAVANKWAPTAGYGPSYMWHVGRVHYEQLTAPKKK